MIDSLIMPSFSMVAKGQSAWLLLTFRGFDWLYSANNYKAMTLMLKPSHHIQLQGQNQNYFEAFEINNSVSFAVFY